jgi:hypothetical protein
MLVAQATALLNGMADDAPSVVAVRRSTFDARRSIR